MPPPQGGRAHNRFALGLVAPARFRKPWAASPDTRLIWAAGLSGFKSVLSTGVQTMAIASLISICWLMFGYSLAFGPGKDNLFIGGSEKFWFMGSGEGGALAFLMQIV